MKRSKRILTKINLSTLFFIAVSFISGTFAWFAYSGLSNVGTEIDIKSWNIEINKNGEASSNELLITLPQISPGMEPVKDTVTITNQGDADALLKYTIKSARILNEDDFKKTDEMTSEFIEDKISHDYPFNINIAFTKDYVKAKGDTAVLEIAVSWPLDSGNDELDSHWGTLAYDFQKSEKDKYEKDQTYSMSLPIELQLEVAAEQYVGGRESLHLEYGQNNEILQLNGQPCQEGTTGCNKSYVIDPYNLIENEIVNLIPDFNTISTESTFNEISTLQDNTRPLILEDILKIISRDVMQTEIVTENLSNKTLGSTKMQNRIEIIKEDIKMNNSIIQFNQTKFSNLKSLDCIWLNTEYSDTHGFALVNGRIYPENKETKCKVIPVTSIKKINFN